MSTKSMLLSLFENNKGKYFSGEEIAKELSVSRAAVWKAVNGLRKDGYTIDAVNNKGYCLSQKNDILSPQGIFKYLNEENKFMNICVLSSVESTNSFVRDKANAGEKEGYLVISNEQTSGRGRFGKKFYSPNESGLYLSLLLRPKNYTAKRATRITTMAAVAMCKAIEDVSDKKPQIKWVNDIIIGGKKVCGILTEASFNLESNMLDFVILGVGINIYNPTDGFPSELENIAGVIFEKQQDDLKNKITGKFINHFMRYYNNEDDNNYTSEYRSYSLMIGKRIEVLSDGKKRTAVVNEIDNDCRLSVTYEDGEKSILSYGEVHIKL